MIHTMHDINVRCTQEIYTYILTHSITSHAYINKQYIIYYFILYPDYTLDIYIYIYCLIPESESSINESFGNLPSNCLRLLIDIIIINC